MPVDIKGQGKSSEEECVYWEKWSGGLGCLFPSNDEGKACAVFCLPGLSSSLLLASSLCVKSQAPVLDSKLQEAKQSKIVHIRENLKENTEYLQLVSSPVCDSVHILCFARKILQTNRAKLWYPACVLQCLVQSVTMWQGDCSVMPIFAPSTAAQQKPGEVCTVARFIIFWHPLFSSKKRGFSP